MLDIFRELDRIVDEFEFACESLVESDYPLVFAGVNGGEDPAESEVA